MHQLIQINKCIRFIKSSSTKINHRINSIKFYMLGHNNLRFIMNHINNQHQIYNQKDYRYKLFLKNDHVL